MSNFSQFYHDASGHETGYSHDASYNIHHGTHYGVDGGWGGHGGHHHAQGFDSATYANAFGGHAHLHHGGFLSGLLGQGGHNHGLLAQLFGLDSKHHVASAQTQMQAAQTQQSALTWANVGRAFQHNLFEDFEVTQGLLFILLIAGMMVWLFVVSFTREHEPTVNKILGASSAQVAAYSNAQSLREAGKSPVVEEHANRMLNFPTPYSKFAAERMAAKNVPEFTAPEMPTVSAPGPIQGQRVPGTAALRPNSLEGTSVRTINGRAQIVVDR